MTTSSEETVRRLTIGHHGSGLEVVVAHHFDAVVAERDKARDRIENLIEQRDWWESRFKEQASDVEWRGTRIDELESQRSGLTQRLAEMDDAVIERDRLRQRVSELSAALAALFGSRNAFTGHLASAYMCNPSCETQARKEAVEMARLALSGEK